MRLRFIPYWLAVLVFMLPHWCLSAHLLRLGENAKIQLSSEADEVVVIHGDLDVAGRVLGNIVVMDGNVRLQKTAYIHGDVVCLGGQIVAEDGAMIQGSKVEIGGMINWKSLPFYFILKLLFYGFLYKICTAIILLMLSFFFVLMWPEQIRYSAEEASLDLVKSTLVGVIALVLLIPLSIGFAITLFGLPIAFALMVFLLVASWFGIASMAYLIGTKISMNFTPLLAVLLGLLLLEFIHFVPFIGTMLYFIAILPGLGATLLTRFGTNKPWLGNHRLKIPTRSR